MQNKYNTQIIWEKWVDPFGENMDEAQWNDYDNEDESIDTYEDISHIKKSSRPIRVIASPMGLIPYNEYTSSAKIFNFWVGHTNFNLSSEIIKEFEKCEGIEILDVFTRYRFRIAIGKCFIDNEVMKNINDVADNFINNNSI